MNFKLSSVEKLRLYYTELDSLEHQLRDEISIEVAVGKHALKASKITKYKIAVVSRAIKKIERIVNSKAEMFENWEFRKHEVENSISMELEKVDELVEVITPLEAEIQNAKTEGITIQELTKTLTISGIKIGKMYQELAAVKKNVENLYRELKNHEKRKPAHATYMDRNLLFNSSEDRDKNEIPEALGIIATTAKEREKTPMDLEIEEFMNKKRNSSIPLEPIEEQKAYADVSFMFEEYDKMKEEEEEKEEV